MSPSIRFSAQSKPKEPLNNPDDDSAGRQYVFRPPSAQLNYNHQTIDVQGGRLYTTDLLDLRLTWQFSNRSFVRTIFVYSDTDRDPALYHDEIDARSSSLNTQLLYSYRFNAQTRFFVGYSDSAMQDDTLTNLEATNHTIFAKFTYAWRY